MEQLQCELSSAFKKPKENIERLLINEQKAERRRVTYTLGWTDQAVIQYPNHLVPVFPNKSVSVWMINYMATPIRHWCSLSWGILQHLWPPTGRNTNSLVRYEGFDLSSENTIRHTHCLPITPDFFQFLKGEEPLLFAQHLYPHPTGWQAPPHSSRLRSILPPLGGPPCPPLQITLPIPVLAPGPNCFTALSRLFYYTISSIKNGVYLTRLFLP